MSRLSSFWRNLRHHDRVERELDDEVRATLDLLENEKIDAGMQSDDARRTAALELGGMESITKESGT